METHLQQKQEIVLLYLDVLATVEISELAAGYGTLLMEIKRADREGGCNEVQMRGRNCFFCLCRLILITRATN